MSYEQIAYKEVITWQKEMIRNPSFFNRISKRMQTKINSYIPEKIQKLITVYKRTASVEGGIIGAGGILLGLAEFPILLGIKLKMLFDLATVYGFDVKDYKERLYILHIFQLAFSSHEHRRQVYEQMLGWDKQKEKLPDDIHQFDWRSFQQEYRDYIDLAKMAQLIPGIGAVVGIVVNYKLIKKLGQTAMNAYRMRLFKDSKIETY